MNKKILIAISIIILIIASIFLTATLKRKNTSENIQNKNNEKILVVYFSAQGHTQDVAQKIAQDLNADIFEIIPEEKYREEDLDWSNENSRVSKEHDNEKLRNIKLKNNTVGNFEEYDTILIGYPIWWGISAWPVNTFVKENNFKDKTVIPFCTSASSDIGQSAKLLEKEAGSGNWKEGFRFSQNPTEEEINSFVNTLK